MSRLGTLANAYDHKKATALLELFPHLASLRYPVFPSLEMDYRGVFIMTKAATLTEDSLEDLIELVREHGLRLSFGWGSGEIRIEFPDDYESRTNFEAARKE